MLCWTLIYLLRRENDEMFLSVGDDIGNIGRKSTTKGVK